MGPKDSVDVICWSPVDPFLFVTAGSDKCIKFWDAKAGRLEQTITTKSTFLNLAWHPEGHVIAAGTNNDEMFFIDARKAGLFGNPVLMLYEMNEIAWAPSGLLFWSAGQRSAVEAYEGSVYIAKPRDGFANGVQVLARIPGHNGQVQCLRFHPSYKYFATCGTDGVISLWSLDDLAIIRTYDRLDYGAKSFSFSHDGQFFATASDDKFVDIVSERSDWRGCCNQRQQAAHVT